MAAPITRWCSALNEPRFVVIAITGLFVSGCTGVTFISPEYAARPVLPLNQQAALARSTLPRR
jgi:hypothetical protein